MIQTHNEEYSTLKNNGISSYRNELENMIVSEVKKFQKD